MVELIENESNRYAKGFYKALLDNGYQLINGDRYVNSKTSLSVICPNGHEWKAQPSNFMYKGSRCNSCFGKSRYTTEEYRRKVYDLVGYDYEVLGEYIDSQTAIDIKHNDCGLEYSVRPNSFLTGRRCPQCSITTKLNTQTFKRKVSELVGNEYKVLGEYKCSTKHIDMKHIECGYEWGIAPSSFIRGIRCPSCDSSKGEKLVESILKNYSISYRLQDKFHSCRNKNLLPFDFGVYDEDELVALVEYQGIQHYEPVEFYGGVTTFKQQQHNDSIKRKWCKDKGILLIEIKYTLTDDEVECFLLDKLTKVSKICV